MALCLILNNFLLQIISFFDQTSSCVSVLVPFVLRWYLSSLWRKIRVSFSRIVHLSLRAACNDKIEIKTLFLKKKIIAKKSVIEIFNVISHDTEKTLLKVSFEYGHNVQFHS